MECLAKHGNTIENIARTPVQKMEKLVGMVGFFRQKAKNIRATAQICIKEHGGRVPRSLEKMIALPGVGPKMAHLTMHAAFDQQEGICVDSHVHRIANSLNWID